MTCNMSWMGYVTRTLGIYMSVLPTKMQLLSRRMLRGAMSQSEKRRMEELGAKVGLTKEETLQAIANYPNPGSLLNVTASRPRIGILALLVMLILIVLAYTITMMVTGPAGAGPTTTYVPGTRYASVSPRDFG
jgi:hypothetical protein